MSLFDEFTKGELVRYLQGEDNSELENAYLAEQTHVSRAAYLDFAMSGFAESLEDDIEDYLLDNGVAVPGGEV